MQSLGSGIYVYVEYKILALVLSVADGCYVHVLCTDSLVELTVKIILRAVSHLFYFYINAFISFLPHACVGMFVRSFRYFNGDTAIFFKCFYGKFS